MAHEVTFIPGDGTGPELAEATRRVLEATGVGFSWDAHPAGEDVYKDEGNPFPDRTMDSIKRTGVGIKGPTTTPVGSGFRSVNVLLRKELDLYACIRPCKAYEGVRTRFPETDIVIVRENTEDLYAGIEFERGTPDNEKLTKFLAEELDSPIREGSGISIKPISEFGSERIVESAFDYAEQYGRKKVTAAHKANIMKHTDGLFLEVARTVAERHPDIESRTASCNLCISVSRPRYDVSCSPTSTATRLRLGAVMLAAASPGANIAPRRDVQATHAGPNTRANKGTHGAAASGCCCPPSARRSGDNLEAAIAAYKQGTRSPTTQPSRRTHPHRPLSYADAVIEDMN